MTTSTYLSQLLSTNPVLLYALVIWSLLWKGLALWKSARKNQKWWFIVILLVNTLGFLEILYIFVFSKEKKESSQKTAVPETGSVSSELSSKTEDTKDTKEENKNTES